MATWNLFSYIYTRAIQLIPISRALLLSVHHRSSVAQGHLYIIKPNLGLPRTRTPLPPSTPFWSNGTRPFFPHPQTISILSDPPYSLTPFLFQLSCARFIPNSVNQISQTLNLFILFIYSLKWDTEKRSASVQQSTSQQAHTISKRMFFGQIRVSWQVRRQAKDNTHVTISNKPVRILNRHTHMYH